MKDPCFSGVWRKLRAMHDGFIWEMRDYQAVRPFAPGVAKCRDTGMARIAGGALL
jgi:hypothetical protein